MPSEKVEALLAEFLDGALSAAGREALLAELERDPAAAAEMEKALAFETLLVAAHAQAPAAGRLVESVRRRAAARPVPRRRTARRWLAVAAAVLLAAGVGALLALRAKEPNQVLSGTVLVADKSVKGIPNGAEITVEASAEAVIRLADQSLATLAPGTQAVLRGPVGNVREVVTLKNGKGAFQVEKAPQQFKVETPVGSVTVTGTKFSVELQPVERKGEGEMRGKLGFALAVAVMAGSVQVDFQGKSTPLAAGQQQVFAEEGKKEDPKKEDPKSTLPEGVAGFSGQVKGVVVSKIEGGLGMEFKVAEVLKVWEGNEATNPQALVGLTVKVSPRDESQIPFMNKLQAGQELVLVIKHIKRNNRFVLEVSGG